MLSRSTEEKQERKSQNDDDIFFFSFCPHYWTQSPGGGEVAGMAVWKRAGGAAACLVELREELIANQASES